MNGILIMAHAPLADALRQCALHVFADAADDVTALDVHSDDPPEQTLAAAKAAFDRLPKDGGVLVLADLFGATPCNVAQRLAEDRPCRLVAGVNLPMLLRALTYRHEPLDALMQRALAGGSQGVVHVDPALPCPQPDAPSLDP
jgi:PTS system ascorbate-specific IIA component